MYNSHHCGISERRALVSPNHTANQLSINGAVASWCEEFGSVDSWSNTRDYGEIRRERARSVISKEAGAARTRLLWYKHQGGMMKQVGNRLRTHL